MLETQNKIKKILLENFNFEDETNSFEIKKELNSLEFVKLILMIENEFNISIQNQDMLNIDTIVKKIENEKEN